MFEHPADARRQCISDACCTGMAPGIMWHVDRRTASLARIAVAFCCLAELLTSWPDACTMFSSDGLLPLDDSVHSGLTVHRFNCAGTMGLLLAHGAASIGLMLGHCPVACGLFTYAMQLSLLHRGIWLAVGDSYLLCSFVLWVSLLSMPSKPIQHAVSVHSLAALGLKLQVVLLYATAAMIKVGAHRETEATEAAQSGSGVDGAQVSWLTSTQRAASPWLDGTAVAEVLTCSEYQRPAGRLLLGVCLEHAWVCAGLTWGTLVLQAASPVLLLVLDGWLRFAAVIAFASLHLVRARRMNPSHATRAAAHRIRTSRRLHSPGTLVCATQGMHATLELGNFSLVSCAGLIIFIPSKPWQLIFELGGARLRRWLAVNADHAAARGSWHARGALASDILSVALIVVGLITSVESMRPEIRELCTWARHQDAPPAASSSSSALAHLASQLSSKTATVGHLLGMLPRADMFHVPPDDCGFWVLPSRLANGSDVDAYRLYHHPHMSATRPFGTPPMHPTALRPLWHRFYEQLSVTSQFNITKRPVGVAAMRRRRLAEHHCEHFSQIGMVHVDIIFVVER